MAKELFIETKKHRRRFNILIFALVIMAEMLFIYGNYHGKTDISEIREYNLYIPEVT